MPLNFSAIFLSNSPRCAMNLVFYTGFQNNAYRKMRSHESNGAKTGLCSEMRFSVFLRRLEVPSVLNCRSRRPVSLHIMNHVALRLPNISSVVYSKKFICCFGRQALENRNSGGALNFMGIRFLWCTQLHCNDRFRCWHYWALRRVVMTGLVINAVDTTYHLC